MFLGIEIGGTKLQLGLGQGDGVLAALWRGPVDVAAGADGIRRQITQRVPEVLVRAGLVKSDLRGIGIGFGGPVDDRTRTVIKSHQIKGWDNFPLAAWLGEMLGLPAILGNDADVAGLAEALFGAGQGLSPIFYITIGSGIGGGLVVDGAIYRGSGRGAAEIGHLRLRTYGKRQRTKTLEELASGWAIGKRARALAKIGRAKDSNLLQSVAGQVGAITAAHVGQAAAQGDAFAWTVLNQALVYLAEALAQVIALLCPRRIVIGGGVSLMGEDVLFKPLREMVEARVFEPFGGCYDIVPARLGEEMVVHGALALAKERVC